MKRYILIVSIFVSALQANNTIQPTPEKIEATCLALAKQYIPTDIGQINVVQDTDFIYGTLNSTSQIMRATPNITTLSDKIIDTYNTTIEIEKTHNDYCYITIKSILTNGKPFFTKVLTLRLNEPSYLFSTACLLGFGAFTYAIYKFDTLAEYIGNNVTLPWSV